MVANLVVKTTTIRFKIVTEEALTKITSLFQDLVREMAREFPNEVVESLYEIRTGNETYSGPSYDEFRKQYEKDYAAENIRLVVQATQTQQQLNPVVSSITLVLDRNVESSFAVLGQSQNNNWVKGVFSRFNDILSKIPTRNVVLHNVLFEMTVQLLAVFVITTFSVFAANKITSFVNLEYSAVYSFVVIVLLLSNLWGYIARGLIAVRNSYYPVVDIRRTPRERIVLTVLSFIALASGTWAVKYVLDLLVIGK